MLVNAILTVIALQLLCPQYGVLSLRIGAFNVQVFGQTKFGKQHIVSTLSQIVRRYDIILVQEIRDSSESVIYSFLDIVNSECPPHVKYNLVVSERLGRSASKEQYAFLYRLDKIEEPEVYQYEDALDHFEREPYGIFVQPKEIGCPPFFILGIHVKPSEVVQEMNQLDEVFLQAAQTFKTENGIILGDFNAGCSYLSYSEYMSLDLMTDTRYSWLIDIHEDTTTTDSDCAYDRIVVSGEIRNYIPNQNIGVFRFDVEYALSLEESQEVSDHFPVEFEVGGTYISKQWDPVSLECDLEATAPGLRVGAFNVRIFGVTKFSEADVVEILRLITHRYDVLLIQEIRDSSEEVIYSFLDVVNSDSEVKYRMAVSDRLGRSTSKEQYAFLYRDDKVELLSLYQEEDIEDVFEREPFCAFFRSREINVPDFFLVGIHTKPSEAVEEINHLDDVFKRASSEFQTNNGIILGDFNADCSYVSPGEHSSLDLVKDVSFTWLIDRKADTTTTDTLCSYDRIVVGGGDLMKYIPKWSAKVFRFDIEYALSKEETQKVSDHYPVEFQLLSNEQLRFCKDQIQVLQMQQQRRDEL